MVFRDYLKEKLKDKEIIEFGPLTRPLFDKKQCKNISYADIRSTEEIKALYSDNDYLKKTGIKVDIDSIVDIDYKINGSYVNTFRDKRFDVAYLSHVIEHMPDIINFFIDINRILKENGELVIIYPDKRYCFDHFRNSVSFRDAYATYKYGIKESARVAFDFGYNVVQENDPAFFWGGTNLVSVISKNNIEDAEKYYKETLSGNITNEDVHFWPFSDVEFLKFIYEMKRANLFEYEIEEFYPTQYNTQEFMVILKKSKSKDCTSILKLINKYDTQAQESEYKIELEEKENEIGSLKASIDNMKNEYFKQEQNQTQQINKKNEQIQGLTSELNEKNKQIQDQVQELNIKGEQIQNQAIQLNEKDNQTKELQKEIQELKQDIEQLNDIIQKYETSKSWKITKPMRRLSNGIKKIIS